MKAENDDLRKAVQKHDKKPEDRDAQLTEIQGQPGASNVQKQEL